MVFPILSTEKFKEKCRLFSCIPSHPVHPTFKEPTLKTATIRWSSSKGMILTDAMILLIAFQLKSDGPYQAKQRHLIFEKQINKTNGTFRHSICHPPPIKEKKYEHLEQNKNLNKKEKSNFKEPAQKKPKSASRPSDRFHKLTGM